MLKTNRAYSRNLGQHSKGYWQKVLYQNKDFHNFPKRGQHLIVKHNIGLKYALNTIRKILTSLFNS